MHVRSLLELSISFPHRCLNILTIDSLIKHELFSLYQIENILIHRLIIQADKEQKKCVW